VVGVAEGSAMRSRRSSRAPDTVAPWTVTTTRIPVPVSVPTPLDVDAALAAALKAAHAEAGKADAAGDVAAFDVWQMAIDALRHARELAKRAAATAS
jgi:hypothetical protein